MRTFPEDFRENGGVWHPRDAGALLDYSDGVQVERTLQRILTGAADLSSDSAELRSHVTDWPTRYHLSPERGNLLRAIDLPPSGRVLELGCGCGALTRYLAETVAHVTACEGSLKRARIARLRCRDMDNVRVVAGNVEDVAFDEAFDVVTLVGVLEYADLYVPRSAESDPFDRLLLAARRHLDRNGILVLAIENRLGIKYLAGSGEDHGLPRFSGIEGYPDGAGPKTFSRLELQRRLARCGFERQALLLPFPDYKLPTAVVNAAYAGADDAARLNLVDWCRQPFEQYDGERAHLFSDHLALASFAADDRLADSSNSFLLVAAGERATRFEPPRWAARKFNIHRRRAYRTELRLEVREDDLTLHKTRTIGEEPQAADERLTHSVEPRVDYIPGAVSLAFRMLQTLRRSADVEAAFTLCLQAWFEFLRRSSGGPAETSTVPGDYLDCTPDNLLIVDDDRLHYVDDEWSWHEPVALDWLLYRGLRSFWHAHEPWIRQALDVDSVEALVRRAAALLDTRIAPRRLRELAELERGLQEIINGPAAEAPPAGTSSAREPSLDHAARWIRRSRGARSIALLGPAPRGWCAAMERAGVRVAALGDDARPDLVVAFEDPDSPLGASQKATLLEQARTAGELLWCPVRDSTEAAESAWAWIRAAGFERGTAEALMAAPGAVLWRRTGALRVTLVSPTSDLHGGTMVIYRHATLLAERGHRVFVASVDERPPDWLSLPPRVSFLPVGADPAELEAGLPDADVLIATLWTTANHVTLVSPRRGRKCYLVQSFESLWAGEPDDVDETYTLPMRKLCVSSWLRDQLRESFDEESSLVINGCDYAGTCEPASLRDDDGPLRIGMLYHEARVKGTADGLSAFARVRSQLGDRVRLVLFGTQRPTPAALEAHEILATCEFHERPDRDELSSMLRGCDLFVSPSLTEGFNLPALEALAHGLPVAMTDCGGCSDYADADTVLLSPPGEPEALAANLLRLCREPELRRRLGHEGRERSRAFTWDRSADQMEHCLIEEAQRSTDPLRILHVGAGPVWFDTFLDPWLVRGFRRLGHEVIEFHPRSPDYRYTQRFVRPQMLDAPRRKALVEGSGSSPAELPAWIRRHRPDLVFVNHGLLLPAAVLDEVRRIGVPTAVWMMDEPQELHYSVNRGRLFDYVFLQDRGTLSRHRKSNPFTFVMPHGADPLDHRFRDDDGGDPGQAEDGCDLLLIGTGFPSRRALVRDLARIDCDVRVIGRQWEGLAGPNIRISNEPVSAEEAGRLYRSARMTLNVHRGGADMASGRDIPPPGTPNGSFFHIPACGSLQLLDHAYPGAGDFLQPGRHYVTFDDAADLTEKVTYYLEHETERRRITRDAAAAVHGFQTYAHRLDEALQCVGRPRVRRRRYGLSPAALEDRDVFDFQGSVPLQSVVLHASGGLPELQRALLGVASGHSDPNQIVVAHVGDVHLERWLDEREIRHFPVVDASGPAGVCNQARRFAAGEYLIYLSDTVLATTHLFRRLVAPMERDGSIGMVAPAVHPDGGPQAIEGGYGSLGELCDQVRRLYLASRGHFDEITRFSPVCFALRRAALDAVGGFDERFPAGTHELTDLGRRLRREGWRTGWTRTTLVHRLAPPVDPDDGARAEAEALLERKLRTDAAPRQGEPVCG